MSWLQIEAVATAETISKLEEEAFAAGAVSVALVSESDEPVLEPAPGEMPLWSTIRLQALFPLDVELKNLDLGTQVDVRFVGDKDWQAYARTFAVDAVFAGRLHLRPPLAAKEVYEEPYVPLFIEPGLAFGSGSHPTTRLCLQWIAENIRPGWKVLDFGCGSGVLAIGAALVGADVVAVDHDDQAVTATTENASANGVSERLTVMNLDQWHASGLDDFDAVVANILAEPLRTLAGELTAVLKNGGAVVLAGLLTDQARHVKSAYPKVIQFGGDKADEDWSLLVGHKVADEN